jgi:16S rRNA (uracil1498-N3)-methyltransferase
MDTIIEQCVELGIAGLVPVGFERSRESVSMPRLMRWRRIALEAMKQSLRSHLADICSPETFDGAIGLLGRHDLVLVASETDTGPICGVLASVAKPVSIALWVGPEGGLTDHELEALAEAGARFLNLGPHRLRSETAAVAAVALVAERFRRSKFA